MASFQRQFTTASPVLALPPQPSPQGKLSPAPFTPQHAPVPVQSAPGDAFPSQQGRKRSRDEAGVNLQPDPPAPAPEEPKDDWVYGEGMVLIKPNGGYVGDASTQSGTWMEEQKEAADTESRRQVEAATVDVRYHKSQRFGSHDDGFSASTPTGSQVLPTITEAIGKSTAPVIDNFTLHLGIGWSKISEDEHIQAAARGWARFIENHYPLNEVEICLESKGLQSYLVKAAEGYFLVSEDLRQARLVSQDAESALRNLQHSPPIFDSPESLTKAESPGIHTPRAADTEMNMD